MPIKNGWRPSPSIYLIDDANGEKDGGSESDMQHNTWEKPEADRHGCCETGVVGMGDRFLDSKVMSWKTPTSGHLLRAWSKKEWATDAL